MSLVASPETLALKLEAAAVFLHWMADS